jgi:cobaltochelatase CobN
VHLLARDTRMLDEAGGAEDLGQTPADLVFLSFSDSDLAGLAAAWQAMGAARPTLRLASLARLRHPMSIDLYAEQVISHARCVVVRLLGGLDYFRYGADEFSGVCRAENIPLLVLPGDGREDTRLLALSTVMEAVWHRMDACLRHGGPDNLALALSLAAHLAGLGEDDGAEATPLPRCGVHALPGVPERALQLAVIVFYRSHLLAADIAPVAALAEALAARGLAVRAVHVSSLKDPDVADAVAGWLEDWRPAVVLNATAFSARGDGAKPSPLDAAGVPVLQLVLSGSTREAWRAASRGLSPTDLAMHVVLPELDGRLLTTTISFKAEQAPFPGLEFAFRAHCPDAAGIALAADRAAGWARLAATPRQQRLLALVLSDYPGVPGQVGHAVGLDTFASVDAILGMLDDAGYARVGHVDPPPETSCVGRISEAPSAATRHDAADGASLERHWPRGDRLALLPSPPASGGEGWFGWGGGRVAQRRAAARPTSPNPLLPEGGRRGKNNCCPIVS